MKLSREEVQRVAVLARLRLTPEEQSSLTEELDRILGYMDKLNQLDTAEVELFSHAANITTPMPYWPTRPIATGHFSKFPRSSNEFRPAYAPRGQRQTAQA